MVKIVYADLFEAKHDLILVTADSFLRKDKSLLMGHGAAKELAEREPGTPRIFGNLIDKQCGHLGFYGLLLNNKYGIFQVKCHYLDDASLYIIGASIAKLHSFLVDMILVDPKFSVGMNYPGIGGGHLKEADVSPLLVILPNSLTIYKQI